MVTTTASAENRAPWTISVTVTNIKLLDYNTSRLSTKLKWFGSTHFDELILKDNSYQHKYTITSTMQKYLDDCKTCDPAEITINLGKKSIGHCKFQNLEITKTRPKCEMMLTIFKGVNSKVPIGSLRVMCRATFLQPQSSPLVHDQDKPSTAAVKIKEIARPESNLVNPSSLKRILPKSVGLDPTVISADPTHSLQRANTNLLDSGLELDLTDDRLSTFTESSLSFSSTPVETYELPSPGNLKRKENWDLLLDLERRALQLRDEVNRTLSKDDWINHANGIDLSMSSNSHSVDTLELHESEFLDRDKNLNPIVPDSLAIKISNCNWCSVEFQGIEIHGKYNGTSQVWIECNVPFSSHQDPYRFRATFPSRRLSLSLKESFKFYVVPEDWKSGGEIFIRVSGVIPKNPKDRFQDTYWKATTALKLNEILWAENLAWQGELILAEVSLKEKAKPFPSSVAGYLKASFKLFGERKSETFGDKIENVSIIEPVSEPKCLGFFLDGLKNASGAGESCEGIYFKIKFFGESNARPVPLVTKQTCSNGCYFIVMIPPHETERPVVLEIFSVGDQGSKADVHTTLRGLVQLPLKDIYLKDSYMVCGPAADFMVSNPFTGKCVGYATARVAIGTPGDVKEYLNNLQVQHNSQTYEDIGIGSESNHSVLNSQLEDPLTGHSHLHLESPIIANPDAEIRDLSLKIEDLEVEFDSLKIRNQDSLSISVTVEMAMDLPLSDDPLANSFSSPFVNINETKTAPPNASVSFQVPEKFTEQFQIVWTDTIPRNTSPTWSFQITLHVEKKVEYLQSLKQEGHLVFKVWDFQESSEDFMTASRSRVNKALIGTAKVNLEPLFTGLTEIYGWYPIRNHVGVSQGQILVKVDPSDSLSKILADLQLGGAVDISPSCACPRKKFDTGKSVYMQSNEPKHAEETWVWDGKEWVYKKLDNIASHVSSASVNFNSIIPEVVAKSPTLSGTVQELENLQRAVVTKYENMTVDSNTGHVLSAKDNQDADYSTDSVTEYPAADIQIADNSNPFLDGSLNYSLENVKFD